MYLLSEKDNKMRRETESEVVDYVFTIINLINVKTRDVQHISRIGIGPMRAVDD